MKSLDQYLNAIRWLLPAGQKQDIVAELSDELRSQIEEREAALGRKLTDDETQAILAQCGHPLLVAERYQPPSYLIGPALFPLYRLVLKMVTLFYLLPWLAVWVGFVVFSPEYRAADPVLALVRTWIPLAFGLLGLITAAFALVERYQARVGILQKWDPRKRPADPDDDRASRTGSVADAVSSIVVVLWWTGVLQFPDIGISLSPAWKGFFWPILLVYLGHIAVALVNVVRPRWTARRAAMRLMIDGAALVVFGLLMGAGPAFVVSNGSVELGGWINSPVVVTLVAICATCVARGIQDVRRLLRKRPIRNGLMTGLAGD